VSQTHIQEHFTVLEVAANGQELMIPLHIVHPLPPLTNIVVVVVVVAVAVVVLQSSRADQIYENCCSAPGTSNSGTSLP